MVKMRKRGACLALALCLAAGSVTSSYASASTVIGGGVAVATEYAFAWLLGAVGLTAASVAVYENADSIMTWGGERLDEFQSFCNEYNSAAENVEEKVNGWCDRVAKGAIDTASDVWEWFKAWASRIYVRGGGSVSPPLDNIYEDAFLTQYLGISVYCGSIPAILDGYCDIPSGYQYIGFEREESRYRQAVTSLSYGVFTNVKIDSSSKKVSYSYKDELGISYWHKTQSYVVHDLLSSGNAGIDDFIALYLSSGMAITLTGGGTYVVPDLPDVSDDEGYAYVGGASDIFDRDGSLDNLDLVGVGAGADVTDVPVVWTGEDDIAKVLAAVAAGTMSWADALASAGVVAVDLDRNVVIDDEGATDEPIAGIIPPPPTVPSELKDYTVDGLSDLFPFCLPFDLIDFIGVLAASPEAPSFTWMFYYPTLGGMKSYDVTVDLSPFDSVAELLRDMQCILFVVGLILITRDQMIKG